MKKITLLWVLCCALYNLPTLSFAQKSTKETDIKPLIGTYWKPAQHDENTRFMGFKFDNEGQISGNDGCNSFYVDYTYSPRKGFKLGNEISTERYCLDQKDFFGVSFLRNCQSYALEGKKLTFYDKEGKEVIVLYSEK